MTFQHASQVLKRIELYLSNAFARNADLLADLLERPAPVPVQAETPLNYCTLLDVKFTHPTIHNIVNTVLLRTA